MAARLEQILAVDQREVGVFTGSCMRGGGNRIFGGQLAAHVLHAAGLSTSPTRAPQSLHGLFLRSGVPGRRIAYRVTTLKEGRAFTAHRVDATQGEHTLFTAEVSFHLGEPSVDLHMVMPDVAPPTEVDTLHYTPRGTNNATREPFDFRYLDPSYVDDSVAAQPRQLIWFRASTPLPETSLVHAAGLVYAVDLCLGRTAQLPLRSLQTERFSSSLDFAIWFHRALQIDEWLLLDVESTTVADSRALASARVFAADGRLVATACQEVLIRIEEAG